MRNLGEQEQNEETEENEVINEETEDSRIKKAKKIKKKHLKDLAELVSKDYVNEDEFRDIVKRNAKSDDKIQWSLRQECLLKEIAEKSLCYCFIHREESNRYRKLYDSSMMQIFSQTMIASILMFISSGFQCTEIENMFIIPLVSGVMNLLIAFQQKILEFKQPERYMLEHESTSRRYKNIYNEIKKELALERKERAIMPDYLNDIHERYLNETKNAPYVCITSYNHHSTGLKNQAYSHDSNESKEGVLDGLPEDVIGFRNIKLNPNDVEYSERKYNRECEYDIQYMLKKFDEKQNKMKRKGRLYMYDSDSDISINDDLSEDESEDNQEFHMIKSQKVITKATVNGAEWVKKEEEKYIPIINNKDVSNNFISDSMV